VQISLYFMLYYLYISSNTQNQNNSYYATLDENFNQALNLFEKEISHQELLELLKNGNIAQKQIAALRIAQLNSTNEALILTQNLVGQDGKIREAVALKLLEFAENVDSLKYLHSNEIYRILLDAIIDVNSNVCRNIISVITILKNNNDFIQYFCPELIKMTKKLIKEVEKFDFQDGKYKVNKEVFKLYWSLETIYELVEHFDVDTIKTIVKQTKEINEYTIREKTAKILSHNFVDNELIEIRNILKNDKNYYVRRF